MAKTKISEFNANPALNTDIDSINLAEGCAPSGINDAIRELMSQLKDWQAGTSNDPMVIGSSGSLTLNQGTANGVAYLNGSKVVTSGSALTFDGTNLGVGIASPGTKVDVAGAVRSSVSGGTPIFYLSNGTTQHSIQNNSGSLAFYNDGTRGMDLTSTGLGIGTSSPSTKVEAAGNIKVSYAASGSNASLISNNTSSTAGSMSQIIATNDASRALRIQYSSSGGAGGSALSGGFSGEVAQIFTDNAYPLSIGTSGVSWLNLSTTGNLGLGVTPSAWSAFKAFEIASVGNSLWSAGSNDLRLATNHVYNGGNKYTVNGYAAQYIQTAGQHQFYTAASGTAGNAITFTQAMTLTASSELLVNRTSASGLGKLNVEGGADFTNGNVLIGRDSGNLLVGTTATVNAAKSVFSFSSSSNGVYLIDSTGVSGAQFMRFDSTSNTCGSITRVGTTSAVAYNTSSDYRLKNTIAPMTGALAKVALLKPCTYKWNADGSDGEGFIAHELAEVVPQCVTGEKDAVDAEGNPKYQGIDVSFLVATLTAAIQELKAEFDAYKASHP